MDTTYIYPFKLKRAPMFVWFFELVKAPSFVFFFSNDSRVMSHSPFACDWQNEACPGVGPRAQFETRVNPHPLARPRGTGMYSVSCLLMGRPLPRMKGFEGTDIPCPLILPI